MKRFRFENNSMFLWVLAFGLEIAIIVGIIWIKLSENEEKVPRVIVAEIDFPAPHALPIFAVILRHGEEFLLVHPQTKKETRMKMELKKVNWRGIVAFKNLETNQLVLSFTGLNKRLVQIVEGIMIYVSGADDKVGEFVFYIEKREQ